MTSLDREEYRQQFAALLPPPLDRVAADNGSGLGRLSDALAAEPARIDERIRKLITREIDPRTTEELLSAWEKAFGLPDDCSGSGRTLEERQEELHARWTSRGGFNRADIRELASAYGADVEVRPRRTRRVRARHGTPYGGVDWQFTVDIVFPLASVTYRRSGDRYGSRYADWGRRDLECLIRRIAPAEAVVRFVYEEE